MRKDIKQEQEEVREVPDEYKRWVEKELPEEECEWCKTEHKPNVIDQEVGLGILFATLACALVITAVGITIPLVEAQPPTGLQRVENEMTWMKMEMKENWLPALKEQRSDLNKLRRRVVELEYALNQMKEGTI